MQVAYKNFPNQTTTDLNQFVAWQALSPVQELEMDIDTLADYILTEFKAEIQSENRSARSIALRMAKEVDRVCRSSGRIQKSGDVRSWQQSLARHRIEKCLEYYRLGAKQGRVELHSTLGAIVYRHITLSHHSSGFQARYQLLEDFLQGFYMESLKAFRRENQTPPDYTPRTQLEIAEYLAFTQQYARRKIAFGGGGNQQLIILRARSFARRQPEETTVDMELAAESGKTEADEAQMRSPALLQVRASMVSEATDPAEALLRDRVIRELVQYLESIDQRECIDYLSLRLQDLPASEINEILGLSPRQRDYLQQRFKYHLERFARIHQWQLVHQWLGADVDRKLGLNTQQWEAFWSELTPQQQQLFELKRANQKDEAIAKTLKCTPKQLQRRWTGLLDKAWEFRNRDAGGKER